MTPKSVRITAIISQIFIIVWTVFSLVVSFNQEIFLKFFIDGNVLEHTDKSESWSVIVYCVACLLLTISNLIMCNDERFNTSGKLTLVPLVASAVTTAALPVAVVYVQNVQLILTGRIEGVNELARLSAYNQIVTYLAYFVYAAMIMSIAVSAVYAYAKMQNPKDEKINVQEND